VIVPRTSRIAKTPKSLYHISSISSKPLRTKITSSNATRKINKRVVTKETLTIVLSDLIRSIREA